MAAWLRTHTNSKFSSSSSFLFVLILRTVKLFGSLQRLNVFWYQLFHALRAALMDGEKLNLITIIIIRRRRMGMANGNQTASVRSILKHATEMGWPKGKPKGNSKKWIAHITLNYVHCTMYIISVHGKVFCFPFPIIIHSNDRKIIPSPTSNRTT